MMDNLTTLFRPVGQKEFALIEQNGFREFPPRLAWQPIFYPVVSLDYAIEIARDWNTKDEANGCVGFVMQFRVRSDYAAKFPAKCVGAAHHIELWVPAEELPAFNKEIVGKIEVIREFRAAEPNA